MTINIPNFQSLAERLIRENGRKIQLLVNPTVAEGGTLHDVSKPWRGTQRIVPVAETSEVNVPFYLEPWGVFVDYTKETVVGLEYQRGDQNLLMAFLDASTSGYILNGKEKIIDGDSDWFIENLSIIRPSELFVYFDLQVRR